MSARTSWSTWPLALADNSTGKANPGVDPNVIGRSVLCPHRSLPNPQSMAVSSSPAGKSTSRSSTNPDTSTRSSSRVQPNTPTASTRNTSP